MAIIYKDCVKQTSTTVSDLSDIIFDADITYQGFQTFDVALSTGDQCYYLIDEKVTAAWEIGIGTFTAPDGLSRDAVLSSSNANAKVDLIAGTNPEISIIEPAYALQSISGAVSRLSTRSSLVAEHEVTGSAATTITFTGLDLNTDIGWTIVMELASAIEGGNIAININGEVSTAVARRALLSSTATTLSSFTDVVNTSAYTGDVGSACQSVADMSIVNRYVVWNHQQLTIGPVWSAGTTATVHGWLKTTAQYSNVTQLEFKSDVSSAIGIGSKIKIYRWLV